MRSAAFWRRKTAGKTSGGSVDLVWVNGENFASLKRQNLLQDEGWAFSLPSFTYTDSAALPALISDFATPTDGLESPWGRASLFLAMIQLMWPLLALSRRAG